MPYFAIVYGISYQTDIKKNYLAFKDIFGLLRLIETLNILKDGLLGIFVFWQLNTSPSRGYTNVGM